MAFTCTKCTNKGLKLKLFIIPPKTLQLSEKHRGIMLCKNFSFNAETVQKTY